MVIQFLDRELDYKKIADIFIVQHCNYDTQFNFEHIHGAIDLVTYQARIDKFTGLIDFYMHTKSMPYLQFTKYNLPFDFFTAEHQLEALTKSEFIYLTQGYFESFSDHAQDVLWNNSLKLEHFEKGYRIEKLGTGLHLIGQTDKVYFSFLYISIV